MTFGTTAMAVDSPKEGTYKVVDPPFNSAATCNVLFRKPAGNQSETQIEAFHDTWRWGSEAEAAGV